MIKMRKARFWPAPQLQGKDKKFQFEWKIGWRVLANSPQFPNWRCFLNEVRTFFDENPEN